MKIDKLLKGNAGIGVIVVLVLVGLYFLIDALVTFVIAGAFIVGAYFVYNKIRSGGKK